MLRMLAILFTEKVCEKSMFNHIMPKKCKHNREGPTDTSRYDGLWEYHQRGSGLR